MQNFKSFAITHPLCWTAFSVSFVMSSPAPTFANISNSLELASDVGVENFKFEFQITRSGIEAVFVVAFVTRDIQRRMHPKQIHLFNHTNQRLIKISNSKQLLQISKFEMVLFLLQRRPGGR